MVVPDAYDDPTSFIRLNKEILYRIARVDYKGKDYRYAFDGMLDVAKIGYAPAQHRLGTMYFHGQGWPKENGMARKWLHKAVAQGYAPSQVFLGVMLYDGDGGIQNKDKAFTLFVEAAKQGHPDGMYMVGVSYHYGHGIPQNYCAAQRWYSKALKQGSLRSQAGLGALYYDGLCVQKDKKKGLRMIKQAAEKGDEYAKELLVNMKKVNTTETASAPPCGQEFNIVPSKLPCGKEWRPWGKWKAKDWCYTDFNFVASDGTAATYCTNGVGTWERSGRLDPCNDKEGWCTGSWR